MAACQLFFWVGCGWSQRAALRRKKAELLRQAHTHSPNFSKATDGGFIKKTGEGLSGSSLFYCGYFSSRPFLKFSIFEPCRIRKPFRFTHHDIRRISKKGYTGILVSELPRCLYNPFSLQGSKKMEVTGLEPVTLCL